MSALQDAWLLLKDEPVEKGIFDRFRRKQEEAKKNPEESEERFGTTSPDPFNSPLNLPPEQPPEQTPEQPMGLAEAQEHCPNCKSLERQLRTAQNTNDALHRQLNGMDFRMRRLEQRKYTKRR